VSITHEAAADLVSEPAIVIIGALALVVILVGTVEPSLIMVRAAVKPLPHEVARDAWLRYAR
jgi:hypothetical protein